MKRSARGGLTLIEVVVAILMLSVGALALAGSSAVMVRRLSLSARGAAAASVGRSRLESSFSKSCDALTAGGEQIFGVRSDWTVAGSPVSAEISQRVTYPTHAGVHADDFLTSVPCQ